MAASFTIGWLAYGREFTSRTAAAAAYFGLSGMLAALAAFGAVWLLGNRPWSARMAAALICLLAGTAGFGSLFTMLDVVFGFHDFSEIPLPIAFIILGISGAGALYNVLAIAAPLIMPLGLPLIALFAVLIARNPR